MVETQAQPAFLTGTVTVTAQMSDADNIAFFSWPARRRGRQPPELPALPRVGSAIMATFMSRALRTLTFAIAGFLLTVGAASAGELAGLVVRIANGAG
jgi:hypothetical protein